MFHVDETNQEYAIRRVVKDDWRNPGRFMAVVSCAVTGAELSSVENVRDIEVAKSKSLSLARKFYT